MHQDVFSRGLEGVGLREPGPLFLQGDPPLVTTDVLPPGHSGGVDYDVSVAHQHSPPRLVSVAHQACLQQRCSLLFHPK